MAKTITQNNVDFTVNTSENIGGFMYKRTHANLIDSSGKYSTTNKQALIDGGYESSGGGFSINAIDIVGMLVVTLTGIS